MGCSQGKTSKPSSGPPTATLLAASPHDGGKSDVQANEGKIAVVAGETGLPAIAVDAESAPEPNSQQEATEPVLSSAEPETGEPTELLRVLEEQRQRLEKNVESEQIGPAHDSQAPSPSGDSLVQTSTAEITQAPLPSEHSPMQKSIPEDLCDGRDSLEASLSQDGAAEGAPAGASPSAAAKAAIEGGDPEADSATVSATIKQDQASHISQSNTPGPHATVRKERQMFCC